MRAQRKLPMVDDLRGTSPDHENPTRLVRGCRAPNRIDLVEPHEPPVFADHPTWSATTPAVNLSTSSRSTVRPRVMGLKEILGEWLEFPHHDRSARRLQYRLDKVGKACCTSSMVLLIAFPEFWMR